MFACKLVAGTRSQFRSSVHLLAVLSSLWLVPCPAADAQVSFCTGDCNADGGIAINELILSVAIALGNESITSCVPVDANDDARVSVSELVQAVNAGLNGCGDLESLFPDHVTACVGSVPDWVAADDLDGDDALDIVAVNRNSNDLVVLLGDGDGNFGSSSSFALGTSPRGGAAIDLDGDDVLELPDVDGDGVPDFVAAVHGDRGLSVLVGDGDGGFGTAQLVPLERSRPQAVTTGDLDADGSLDAVAVSSTPGDGDVRVAFGLAAGTSMAAGIEPRDVEVADFNGDGIADIAASNLNSDDIAVFAGKGDGSFDSPFLFSAGTQPRHLAVADLDDSGSVDIVAVNQGSDDVSVLLGNGDATFAAPRHYPVGNNPRDIAVADLDGDGRRDIVTANRGSDSLSVLIATETGLFRLVENVPLPEGTCDSIEPMTAGPRGVAVADWNGDGKLDLVSANSRNGSVTVAMQR